MAQPEEFKIHIEQDGQIIFDGNGVKESSWRRIMELLEETVGPVREVEAKPGDPPRLYLKSASAEKQIRQKR